MGNGEQTGIQRGQQRWESRRDLKTEEEKTELSRKEEPKRKERHSSSEEENEEPSVSWRLREPRHAVIGTQGHLEAIHLL